MSTAPHRPLSLVIVATCLCGAASGPAPEAARGRLLVESMKKNPRGPYRGVAWFCMDGTEHPPRAGACATRGGGRQHGVLSADALALAAGGVHVGTVLAALAPEGLLAEDHYRARALVVERFLERALDGWVLRAAKGYRGARQIEDEEAAAIVLLQHFVADRERVDRHRNLALRLVRSLPYGPRDGRTDEIRALASQIGDLDPRFDVIRAKIHSLPEPTDIDLVARYLPKAPPTTRPTADTLLEKLSLHYDPKRQDEILGLLKRRIADRAVQGAVDGLLAAKDAPERVRAAARLLSSLDRALHGGPKGRVASRNLILLHGMGVVEERLVDAAAELSRAPLSRQSALELVATLCEAGRALGLLSAREVEAAQAALALMVRAEQRAYAQGLDRLSRILEWIRARHVADFGKPLARYQEVEPEARYFVDDLLRSGAALSLATLLDRLYRDVERLRRGGHVLVEIDGSGLRGENPGLATGRLRVLAPGADPSGLRRDEIVLMHELGPDLPPVAGLLTVGPAGSLAHVSLLAQNLGIPHVAVSGGAATTIERWAGRVVTLGVSATRRVVLGPKDALPSDLDLGPPPSATKATLHIDASRLDLAFTQIRTTAELSEKEAGARVGPKAAELARLERLFPDRVSDAAVIPFGAFVRHVDREDGEGGSPLARLRAAYVQASKEEEAVAEARLLGALAEFRAAIDTLPFAPGFEQEVGAALGRLGSDGSFGVFVRSDTNVEDLENFTGAGLNLTVPNRVGLPSVLRAIRAVWASPFSERSFRWRQQLLDNPEHVYPSVLLHRTVPSEISGVVVTTDIETGEADAMTISMSEGVAAVVDGGSAETIVVGPNRAVRLLASSRIFERRRIPPPPMEGVVVEAAARADPLLDPAKLDEVVNLVDEVVRKVGRPSRGVAWDIELGLLEGRAWLFQIRPLKASKVASAHPTLRALDAKAALTEAPLRLEEALP